MIDSAAQHDTPHRPRGGAWRWLLDVVVSRDKETRTRTSMALSAVALMTASTVVMFMLARFDVAPMRPVFYWALLSNASLWVMTAMIRSGYSKRFADPSMTQPQMFVSIASGAVAYVLGGTGRGVVPAVLSLILFFGTLGLTRRQMIGMGIYALVAFAVAIAWGVGAGYHPADVLGAAYAGMVAIVLGGCLVITMRIESIRRRLHEQRAELKRALGEIQALAMRDPLTGLLNRRHMMELLTLQAKRHNRSGSGWVILQLDIDFFKKINDSHGHAAGDAALQAFAQILLNTVRESDAVSRWGGEEFVVMMLGVSEEEAGNLAERVRAAVQAHEMSHKGRTIQITTSIGYTAHRPGEPVEATLERADKCLYRAKREGRNRVVASGNDSLSSSMFS